MPTPWRSKAALPAASRSFLLQIFKINTWHLADSSWIGVSGLPLIAPVASLTQLCSVHENNKWHHHPWMVLKIKWEKTFKSLAHPQVFYICAFIISNKETHLMPTFWAVFHILGYSACYIFLRSLRFQSYILRNRWKSAWNLSCRPEEAHRKSTDVWGYFSVHINYPHICPIAWIITH